MQLGPLMIDVMALELTAEDREILKHPLVGGVILFTRNYENTEQLQALINDIKKLRDPRLIIAVDHEGGRVQRFREGFTRIPPMRNFGDLYQKDKQLALKYTEQTGWLLAAELLAMGVDFSFTPVVDLDYGVSTVIGDRSFSSDPHIVALLAASLINGLHNAGMAAVAKHFPGHGAIAADSHIDIPVDERDLTIIEQADLIPFFNLIKKDLDAVMPAHVIFPKIDDKPVGFSQKWLQELLRQKYQFSGAIFSDCLSMAGATIIGDYPQRAREALSAGCDICLICNDRNGVISVLDKLSINKFSPLLSQQWERMRGKQQFILSDLKAVNKDFLDKLV